MTSSMERRKAIVAVYFGGFVAGISLLIFPAAGSLLTDPDIVGLSNSQFGMLFTPEILAAIIASSLAAGFAAKVGIKRVMIAGLGFNLVAMVLMAATVLVIGNGNLPFVVLMMATAAVGAGFGFTISALNVGAFELFPGKEDSAVTGLHVMTGLGAASSSLVLSFFNNAGLWWVAPAIISIALAATFLFSLTITLGTAAKEGEQEAEAVKTGAQRLPRRIWLYAVLVFFYGICEATFNNWTTIFLEQDAGLSTGDAALGFSVLWISLTGGRVLFSIIAIRFSVQLLHVIMPVVIGLGFFLLPTAEGAFASYLALAIGGLGLSFYLPYSVSLASAENPRFASVISGILMAAFMVGIGFSANVIGFARDALGLSAVFQLSTVYAVAMTLIAFYLFRSYPKVKSG